MSESKEGGCSLAAELMRALSPSATIRLMPPEGTVFGDKPEEELEMITKIGEGSFGTVWRAIHKPSQSYVAVKKVSLDGEDEAIKEGSTMEKLCHQNIVRFYAFYKKPKEAWMVMELCAAKSMHAVMKSFKRGLTEKELACTLQQTLKGLAYVHAQKRIHRDIKSGNLLLQQDGRVKLCDFGVAGELTSEAKRHTMIGSPYWMAPEIIDDAGHDEKADIWSLGITAIELCEMVPPRFSENTMRAVFLISSSPPPTLTEPDKFSAELNDFLSHCLIKNPDDRYTSEQLLQHPFIKNAEKCCNSHTHALDTPEQQKMNDRNPGDCPCCLAELATQCTGNLSDSFGSPVFTGINELNSPTSPIKSPGETTNFDSLGTFGTLSDLTLPSTLKADSKRLVHCTQCDELKAKIAELEKQVAQLTEEIEVQDKERVYYQSQVEFFQKQLASLAGK